MHFNQAKRGCKQESQINSVFLNSFQGLAKRMKQGNPLYKLHLRLDFETSLARPLWGKQGFTLIELLVVVLIIGILAAVALPQYQKAVEKSRSVQALALIKSMVQAAKTYELANGTYPTSFEQLDVSLPNWTGNTFFYGGTEAKSNGEWSIILRNESGWEEIMIGKISGKYKGAGFKYVYSKNNRLHDKIQCMEVVNGEIPFQLNEGDYCVKIMNGSLFMTTNVRIYDLP